MVGKKLSIQKMKKKLKKLINLIAGFVVILVFIYHINNENWIDAGITVLLFFSIWILPIFVKYMNKL